MGDSSPISGKGQGVGGNQSDLPTSAIFPDPSSLRYSMCQGAMFWDSVSCVILKLDIQVKMRVSCSHLRIITQNIEIRPKEYMHTLLLSHRSIV